MTDRSRRGVAELPRIDEHSVVIAADAAAVWSGLLETLDRSFSRPAAAAYARVVGCADRDTAGPRPLTEGSSLPGFRVVAAAAPYELVLTGRHRFSTYALVFRIESLDAGVSRLRAESRASFPGVPGRVYRTLVLRSGAHVVGVRRLLHRVGVACAP